MYLQNNNSFDSNSRRLSTNPFRASATPPTGPLVGAHNNRSTSSVFLSNSAFEDWVKKNKTLIDLSDEEEPRPPQRPSFPTQSRTGSDSNVNYRYVSIRFSKPVFVQ